MIVFSAIQCLKIAGGENLEETTTKYDYSDGVATAGC
jgi:hypothetical protein